MLTPRVKINNRWYRLTLHVSAEDEALIGRGKGWSAVVEENSGIGIGRKWKIKAASCGMENCFCDAIAVEQRPKPKKRRKVA
jgi:hypothetical protein